jgi:hypothetical protein
VGQTGSNLVLELFPYRRSFARKGRSDPKNDKGLDVAFAQQLRLASSTPELILPTLRSQTKNALLRRVSCARSDSFAWAANYLNETSKEKEDEVHREVRDPQGFCR